MISPAIYKKIYDSYGTYFEPITGVPAKKITDDVLSFEKPKEQIALLSKYVGGNLAGKKLLEIGSGFGNFVIVARKEYQIDAWGIEPGSEGFGGSFELSQEILKENDVDGTYIKKGVGENISFPDNHFDVVFSTNVLEHVNDPKKVLAEAIRVCKPGGYIQIVVPSYGSFYDGHYSCLYLPYQPLWLWKLFIKIFLKKDSSFAGTIRTEINYFSIKRWIKPFLKQNTIEVLTFGEEVFRNRIENINFSTWAGLEKVKRWIVLAHKLKISHLAASFLILIKAHTPIILTLKKK